MQIHKYLIGLVIGVLIMLAFFAEGPTTIYTPKVYVRRDVSPSYDTLPLTGVDTILVAHPTPKPGQADTTQYKIPVWRYQFDDSLPFVIGRNEYQHPFRLHVWGYVKRYDLENRPMNEVLEPRINKSIVLWKIGAVGFGVIAVALTAKILLD